MSRFFVCFILGTLLFSCTTKDEVIPSIETTTLDLEQLIVENTQKAEAGTINFQLSAKEFEQALSLATQTTDKDAFFKNEELRNSFRKAIRQVWLDNKLIPRSSWRGGDCGKRFFAESFTLEQGYTSSNSDSFASVISYGKNHLWASSYDCLSLQGGGAFIYRRNCPFLNSDNCMARAFFYQGAGNANIFPVYN